MKQNVEDMFQGLMSGALSGSVMILAADGNYAPAAMNALIVSAWLWFLFRPICQVAASTRQQSKEKA